MMTMIWNLSFTEIHYLTMVSRVSKMFVRVVMEDILWAIRASIITTITTMNLGPRMEIIIIREVVALSAVQQDQFLPLLGRSVLEQVVQIHMRQEEACFRGVEEGPKMVN